MNAYRDPLPHEARQYRQAIAEKDAKKLQRIVSELYPNVIWGEVTKTLSEFDHAWVMKNLTAVVEEEFD